MKKHYIKKFSEPVKSLCLICKRNPYTCKGVMIFYKKREKYYCRKRIKISKDRVMKSLIKTLLCFEEA